MGSESERRCASGPKCRESERLEATTRQVGKLLSTSDGLCDGCLINVERAVVGFNADFAECGVLIGEAPRVYSDQVSYSREIPVPIRLTIEELRRCIFDELTFWATELGAGRQLVNRSMDDKVRISVDYLAPRIGDLLKLGPTPRASWNRMGEPAGMVKIDGIAGALRFVELRRRVRVAAGRSDLVHRLTPACPWCDQRSLVRHNGSSHVACEACDKIIPEKHYDWFVATVIREQSRVAA